MPLTRTLHAPYTVPMPNAPKRNRGPRYVTLANTVVDEALDYWERQWGERNLSRLVDHALQLYLTQQRKATKASTVQVDPAPPPSPSIPRVSGE